jgi:ATP-binding cassette subfamily B protein
MRGEITLGNIAEFVIYVNMLTWPVASLGWVTSIIQRAAASQERLNEFMHLKPEISSPTSEPFVFRGKIGFHDVGFVYPDSGVQALEGVSFTVNPGQTLAILGNTGSGKSTLANLLLRLYDTTSGEIRVDDRPLNTVSLYSLRHQVGYVPQDVFLFSDSIANNISFGLTDEMNPEERQQRVEEAARQAVVYDNIAAFPKGFETKIGERGITLSGGQKQRVSIARAIIKNPPVLLFDDCLSAVDTETEETILENLRRQSGNRTTILISHRVSSVKHADEIILLENGRIREQGTHGFLLQKKGAYYELYEKQLLEKEKVDE